MKTTNNVQKTEKTKLQRILMKSVAVIISFVLISLTVSAHGFWKQILVNNSYGKMAVLMVDQQSENQEVKAFTVTKSNLPAVPLFASFIQPASDESLQMENWMLNGHFSGSAPATFEKSADKDLAIEPWMLDQQHFTAQHVVPETDSDCALDVEGWMVNDNFWNF